MKKVFIKEHTIQSHLWFVCNCTLEEFSAWLKKKFNYIDENKISSYGFTTEIIDTEKEVEKQWR